MTKCYSQGKIDYQTNETGNMKMIVVSVKSTEIYENESAFLSLPAAFEYIAEVFAADENAVIGIENQTGDFCDIDKSPAGYL